MLRIIACSFLILQGASAGDLAIDFDPIPGVIVSKNQVVVGDGIAQDLAGEYPLVQLFVANNAGLITSIVHDSGGKISLPNGADFSVITTASGTSYQVSVREQKNWKTLIATSQQNEGAEVLSVGNFQVSARKNETRSVRAAGNKIIYQNSE